MSVWNVEFFPPKGERNAPSDQLKEICNADEIQHIQQKLRVLQELEQQDWNFGWLKPIKSKIFRRARGFYQIREGDFRGYFNTIGKKIIVLHFCRKVGN